MKVTSRLRNSERFRKVYINRDMTAKERETERKLRGVENENKC